MRSRAWAGWDNTSAGGTTGSPRLRSGGSLAGFGGADADPGGGDQHIFWGAEGAGADWPGANGALLILVPAIAASALGLVAVPRRRREAELAKQSRPASA